MQTTQGWGSCAFSASHLFVATLCVALFCSGCRQHDPTNPFLADRDDPLAAEAQGAMAGDTPLAGSLARLQQRGAQFQDAAAQASQAANGLGDDARAVARDAASQAQHAAVETLDQAEAHGRRMAVEAAAQAQQDAIASLEEMPLEQAGPILLVAMSRGTPIARQAAAEQLSRRWPPAAGYAIDSAAAAQQQALAELRGEWVRQYGQIDERVAAAQAQAARLVDTAGGVVDEATATMHGAQQRINDVRQVVATLREADLPQTARQELAASLERAASDASAAVRANAAQAMGEAADPMFVPALVAMLGDQPEVQAAALDSLERVSGRDVAGDRTLSNEERARMWQMWFSQQQPQPIRNP